jgi:hypothetical protein
MAARKRVSDSAFWSIYNAGVRDGRARAEAAAEAAKKKPAGGKIHTIQVATPKPKTAAAGKKKPAATAVKPPNKRRKQTAIAR